jgi:hypothetical protein
MSERKHRVRGSWRRWLAVGGLVGAVAAGVCWWSNSPLQPVAQAQAPQPYAPSAAPPVLPPSVAEQGSDYAKRVVAYCLGKPVTREMLGEYLIQRYGPDKVELMVNKLLIDSECQARGIEVTSGEIEAALADDLKGLSLDRKQFVESYLKSHHLNLVEWKEDVIRPKLQLAKLVHDRVKYTEEEVKTAYDAYYGERIEARLIVWPKEEEKHVLSMYNKLRDNPDEFDKVARMQCHPELSAKGGALPKPIGWHTTGDEKFEKDLFSLQPGELTQVHQSAEGLVVAKCIKRLPPDNSVRLEAMRPALVAEIVKKKTVLEIPVYFAELRKKAEIKLLMKNPSKPEDLASEVKQVLNETGGTPRSTQAP